jgi:hypothetical protein
MVHPGEVGKDGVLQEPAVCQAPQAAGRASLPKPKRLPRYANGDLPRLRQPDDQVEQRRDHVDVLVAVQMIDRQAVLLGPSDLGSPFRLDLAECLFPAPGMEEPPQPHEAAAEAN